MRPVVQLFSDVPMMETTLNNPKISRMCTEKVAFITLDEAKRAKHSMSKATGMKLSVYRCSNCRCWHFTSIKESD